MKWAIGILVGTVLLFGAAIIYLPERRCVREEPENATCGVETICTGGGVHYCARYRDACKVMRCAEWKWGGETP